MRIAMMLGCFPVLSETFILRQITGLLELGHEVDIYAEHAPPRDAPQHPDVDRFNLLARTRYLVIPRESGYWEMPVWPITGKTWLPDSGSSIPNAVRVLRAMPALVRCGARSPALAWQVLQPAEYGAEAKSLSSAYRLANLARVRRRYDVIHAHFGPVGDRFRFVRALWRAPLVVTFHGYDFSTWPRAKGSAVYRPLFDTVDAVTVNSLYTRDCVITLGCDRNRIHVLHVGTNVDEFTFAERVRQRTDTLRILTVGRLVEKKGIEYAIRGVAEASARGAPVHYDVIGDGPLRSTLEQLVGSLGVRDHVALHGARDSRFVQQAMSEAHAFVLPSVTAANGDQEGTPVSLMEAQASGLPVIATRHSGIPETVLDAESGILVEERDVTAVADAIELLVSNPEACRRMGRRGRRHVEDQFDIRKLNRDLVEIYEHVREGSPYRLRREPSPRVSLEAR